MRSSTLSKLAAMFFMAVAAAMPLSKNYDAGVVFGLIGIVWAGIAIADAIREKD